MFFEAGIAVGYYQHLFFVGPLGKTPCQRNGFAQGKSGLEVYAASLVETYGQEKVHFLYAQPTVSLVEGIATPQIEDALGIEFDQWPKSLEAIVTQLGTLAAEKLK